MIHVADLITGSETFVEIDANGDGSGGTLNYKVLTENATGSTWLVKYLGNGDYLIYAAVPEPATWAMLPGWRCSRGQQPCVAVVTCAAHACDTRLIYLFPEQVPLQGKRI